MLMSPAISKDRTGVYTLIHYPGTPGLPYGRVGSLRTGNEEIWV